MLHSRPNMPVERAAHSAGFVAVPGFDVCGPPLNVGVDMTRDVKSRVKIFDGISTFTLRFSLAIGRAGARQRRRWIPLISVG